MAFSAVPLKFRYGLSCLIIVLSPLRGMAGSPPSGRAAFPLSSERQSGPAGIDTRGDFFWRRWFKRRKSVALIRAEPSAQKRPEADTVASPGVTNADIPTDIGLFARGVSSHQTGVATAATPATTKPAVDSVCARFA